MKYQIESTSPANTSSGYTQRTIINTPDHRYIMYDNGDQIFESDVLYDDELPPDEWRMQISVIRPYDLSEYYWAKVEFGQGKIIDGNNKVYMTFQADYDEDFDEYETFSEFQEIVLQNILETLEDLNDRIEPRIDHT